MNNKFEIIHTVSEQELQANPHWNMPYVPAIRVLSGRPLYISGVNAAPIYHSHPHKPEEFNHLDLTPEAQVTLTMNNLKRIIEQVGGKLTDIVQLMVFIVDVEANGDRIGKVVAECFAGHVATSTVVGVNKLITDSRFLVEITAVAYV